MITYTQGNLLDSRAEALVNTVNTVGVMGKGIALMFKDRFQDNYRHYVTACKANSLSPGHIFVTENHELDGPRWIVNFPTKKHWRGDSRIEWIEAGLQDLRHFLIKQKVRSSAIPPLGAGNGGLDWAMVKPRIENALHDLTDVEITVYEPTAKYQNVAKREGVTKLTVARALIAELVRQYWVLGMECSLLEIQKLAWFMERSINKFGQNNSLSLQFSADKYGPYAHRLTHLLNNLDGSYLHCDKRIGDADPLDVIWFDESSKDRLQAYLGTGEALNYSNALNHTLKVIDGFETPYGMELLATVDWLLTKNQCSPTFQSIKSGLESWPAGEKAAQRKLNIFDERSINIALGRLLETQDAQSA